jgi:MYXO-CTERM domain-containing protein
VDGTSPATAIVSGAAALVRAKFPQISAQEVIHRLTATADDIGPPGRDNECGFGVLNIVKALTADVPPLATTASASPSATTTTTTPASPAGSGIAQSPAPASGNTPVVIGGVVFGLALVGGLFLLARRRRGSG